MIETNTKKHEEEKIKTSKDKHPPTPGKERTKKGIFDESWTREKNEKIKEQFSPSENETYRIIQALLLATSVLVLSYHGFRYGRTEYSVLENGQIVNGFVSARRAVITFSLGYSVTYSLISTVAACMLLYSLHSRKPRWSLSSIIVYMIDLVCHVGDALVAFWLFFGHLKLSTALFYTAIIAVGIAGELWIWFGVLRLYEYRTFK